jgi:Rrf2 family protein
MASSSRFAIAVHTLALLANYEGKALKSEFVACLVKTNPVVIRRLLCELSRADLVESQSGAHGGTWLKRRPAEITLWEIYQAVESAEVFSLHHPATETQCAVSSNIEGVLTDIQQQVNAAIEQTLQNLSLGDVLQMLITDTFNDEGCRKYQGEE